MAPKKINCWEFKKCGREPGGDRVGELGVCPAATDQSFHEINAGQCGGRICWAVAGTLCKDSVQGSFAEKRESCLNCSFFLRVQAEEGTANLRTKFLKFLLPNSEYSLFRKLPRRHVKAGERIITQGEISDAAYIIQRGSCLVIVEKNGNLHPSDHRGAGDVAGFMGLLTGEPQPVHVEAETDVDLWVVTKTQVDDLAKQDPNLLDFLTELVADRFDSRRPTADRTIGKYVAKDIIGRGGFSVVYRGFHEGLGLPVAIKMLRHHMATRPDFIRSFQNEAKIIGSLNHENIVKVFDIEERFKTVFIIMEYLKGELLKDYLNRKGQLSFTQTAYFLAQILSGLACAHENGIIHRDVTPSNILVQKNERLKILDFGLACPAGDECLENGGTLYYMAPEQIEGAPEDSRTDIYALGICAYEMVVGARPFPEKNAAEIMKYHVENDIPDPKIKLPDIPEILRRFIIRAGYRDPSIRYQNAVQAFEDIAPLMRSYVSNGRETMV